jgi:ankyrin repeat protein
MNRYGNALTAAAYDGTIDIIKMLLDAGADINSPDGWALQHAAGEGHVDVVNLLLERGANVNACSSHSNMPQGTALQAAVESGQSDIVDILLEHGADPNLGGGEFTHPIIAAASKGEEAIFKRLLDAKVDVTVVGGEYMSTPLTYAAIYLPTDSIRLILDAGADINHVDNEGDTALIVTAGLGDHETVRLLLDYGADVLVQNNEGLNALRKALAADRPVCVKMLVEHVSDLMEAMRVAIESGDASVAAVVRSVQNKKQELNYDDPVIPEVPGEPTHDGPVVPEVPAEPAHDESRRSSVYGPVPPETEGHAVNPEPVAYHPEIILDDHHNTPSHGVTLQEPIARPSITPSGPSATSVHDLYSPAHEFLDHSPDVLFRRQSELSTPTGGQPSGPIRRKPISGGKPPLYRPYQPNGPSGPGENVRHSSPPEALANAFQAYQPLQPQAQQEPGPSTSPPSHTSPEPGFVPYAPGPINYAQPDSEARRKSLRSSFMGMKVPWSDNRFG